MKKLLTAIAVLGAATLAFGQGQVAFVNTSATLVSTNQVVNGAATGATINSAGKYYFGAYWAPAGTTDASAFTFFAYGTNLASAGRFTGGAGAGSPSIAGQTAGTSVNVLFRGWGAEFGTPVKGDSAVATAVAAAAASIKADGSAGVGPSAGFWYGESAIGTVILGGGATPIATPFNTIDVPGQVSIKTGFVLGFHPVPEPSTMALAGLGAAALLVFRRRK